MVLINGKFEFKDSDSMEAKYQQASAYGHKRAVWASVHAKTTFNALARSAKKFRWGNPDPNNLTPRQLKQHVTERLKTVSPGQVKNEMSYIRRALKAVGRDKLFSYLTNDKLEIPERFRTGKGKPTDQVKFAEAKAKACKRTLPLILLTDAIGLRSMELVRANDSLNEWKHCLKNDLPLRVKKGAKGGRERFVNIAPADVAAALHAVHMGITLVEAQGWLVKSKNPGAASQQFRRRLKAVGLCGENSPHSLRRAFIMRNYRYYRSINLSQRNALSMCAIDLGHGDHRGRWVYNNYLRTALEAEKT
jgi:integrase